MPAAASSPTASLPIRRADAARPTTNAGSSRARRLCRLPERASLSASPSPLRSASFALRAASLCISPPASCPVHDRSCAKRRRLAPTTERHRTTPQNGRSTPTRTRLMATRRRVCDMRSITSRSPMPRRPTLAATQRLRPRPLLGARPTSPAVSGGHQARRIL